jgi:hypothetical protein
MSHCRHFAPRTVVCKRHEVNPERVGPALAGLGAMLWTLAARVQRLMPGVSMGVGEVVERDADRVVVHRDGHAPNVAGHGSA